jgi:hypothetical protein
MKSPRDILIAMCFVTVFVLILKFSKYRELVNQNLKDGELLTLSIILEPEKLTDLGLKYRRLAIRYFVAFASVIIVCAFICAWMGW